MATTTAEVEHVSDTARWVAVYRAMESERPDALFHDRFARKMAGERGEAIMRGMPRGKAMAWPMIVRTAVLDEMILDAVRAGVKTVMNLAAGLDTRAWRLALPATLRWVDADFPAMIDYRESHLAGEKPACRHEHAAIDLRDPDARRALFARVAAEGPVLVVTEGLLIYLTPEQVGALARDLHEQPAIRWWLSDLASPFLLQRMARQWGNKLAAGGAPFIFGPAEGTKFFEAFGWREAQYRSMWLEAKRLKRTMPMVWLWELLGRLAPPERRKLFVRMSGMIQLERA